MSASRSPKRTAKPARRSYGWLAAAALLAASSFVLLALPASVALRFLPAGVQADDASGTLWHGSSAQVTIRGRPIGAIEWRLHPLPLLGGRISAELRWIKNSFVIDAGLQFHGAQIFVHGVRGGGALEDLADIGAPQGWSGNMQVAIAEFRVDAQKITAAAGTVRIGALKSRKFAEADLGAYELAFSSGSVQADGTAIAQLRDLSGPLQLSGALRIAPAQNQVNFTGTVKERVPLPPSLQQEFQDLVNMRGRDTQGRVPLEIEFAL